MPATPSLATLCEGWRLHQPTPTNTQGRAPCSPLISSGQIAAFPVTAALLATAAPASAQIGPSTIGSTTPPAGAQIATSEVFELNTFGGNELAAEGFNPYGDELAVTSLKADSNEVAVEGFKPAR